MLGYYVTGSGKHGFICSPSALLCPRGTPYCSKGVKGGNKLDMAPFRCSTHIPMLQSPGDSRLHRGLFPSPDGKVKEISGKTLIFTSFNAASIGVV